MANPNTPYGFKYVGLIEGGDASFGIVTGYISPSNGNKIYAGDVAKPISGGYYDVAAEVGGGEQVGGIFLGFEWQSITAKMTIRDRAWLGNTADIVAGGTLRCKIAVHPHAKFQVRTNGSTGSPIGVTGIGTLINFTVGAGPGNNLVSTFALDQSDTGGASQPFKVFDICQPPESDPTSLYNEVFVIFNNLVSA